MAVRIGFKPNESNISKNGPLQDQSIKAAAAFLTFGNSGYMSTVARRENGSVAIVPLKENVSFEDINVEWNRDVSVDDIALVAVADANQYKKTELTLKSAVHSKHKDVTKELLNNDKKYAEIEKTDVLDLTFDNPVEPENGWVRDFVLVTTGRYDVLEENSSVATKKIPNAFDLYVNSPNPFNPTTIIVYALKENVKVSLKIYNVLGQEVRTLVNETQSAGYQSVLWDGKNNAGSKVPAGIYFYTIRTGKAVTSGKIVLMPK